MSKFTIKNFVSLDDVKKMCELDQAVYDEFNQVPFEICKTWYEKNPHIYTAIFNNDELIGYINFMPISDELYNKFITGTFMEQNISADDIMIMESGKEYYTLFSSVVISEKYKNTNAFFMLLSSFYKNMKTKLTAENIKIKSTIADCVNKKIKKFVIDSNFKQVIKNKDFDIMEGNIF